MNNSSSSQSNNSYQENGYEIPSADEDMAVNISEGESTIRNNLPVSERLQASRQRRQQKTQSGGLEGKVIAWAIALSVVPVLAIGTLSYLSHRSLQTQIKQAQLAGASGLVATETAIKKQLPLNLAGTGILALLGGAIATLLTKRTMRPVLQAVETSTTMVNRLYREEINTYDRMAGKDELKALEQNLETIQSQLPELLWKEEAEAERFQVLMNITRRLREARSQEEVLRATVEETRQALRSERVAIFRFDSRVDGTIVEESVASGLPKMLWTTMADPCLEDYLEPYRNGRMRAIDDIHNADLNDCHIGLLDRFAVKANLIAPILKDGELFGLLIVNQCSEPRIWQQPEIDLLAQIAIQVGFALDYAKILEQLDQKIDRAQLFINITRRIRESLNEDDILKTTVEEVRKAIRSDRVIVYTFDAHWYGTIVAESVVPGLPKSLHAQIKDPCFAQGYVQQYQAGRVQATDNIYEARLTECHIRQLKAFGVQANLVAPILKDGNLFGLLIAHQCTSVRHWQPFEIDLFAQLAMQVGYALDHARFLKRLDIEEERTQLLAYVTRRIRESLIEEDILNTTVQEIRKAIKSDRVVVYRFNENGSGLVASEAVSPGWIHALNYKIEDACIPDSLHQAYLEGRVVATNNVFEADFHPDHLALMEKLGIKANLVAPILKDGHLFGLLIAHQCSNFREWQPSEINLLAQLAIQVGFALDHARLLDQVEQAYQVAEITLKQERQEKQALQRQVGETIQNSQSAIKTLSSEANAQMEAVTSAYNQLKVVADASQSIAVTARKMDGNKQQITQSVQNSQTGMNQIVESMATMQGIAIEVIEQLTRLKQPTTQLTEVLDPINQVASQLKLQAMNVALEAARKGEAGKEFAAIGEKVLTLARQLEGDIGQIQPIVTEIQSETTEITSRLRMNTQKIGDGTLLLQDTQQKLQEIAAIALQINSLVEQISQTATRQHQTATSASQSVLELATLANRTAEHAMIVVESFNLINGNGT